MRILLAAPLAAVLVLGVSAPVAAGQHGQHGQHGTSHGHGHSGDGGYARHAPRPGVTDQDFYFVMGDRFANGDPANDTGGLGADPLVSGFDATKKGFYNGGDLDGLRSKLDYVQGLGTDAIWLTPIFKNKAVQLEDGPSAGYHGYWITDFTQVDPHLGTNQDLAELVDAAHDRGMKVYFDIITNHTADVIGYSEGARRPYVSKDAVPYRDAAGQPFDDRDYAGTSSFPALDPATSFPYHPVLDPAEENLKSPAWLNDLTMYHNRGDTTFVGENSQYGDFFGLDDLFTERPEVVDGMIDIYQTWVEDFDIDGFRIDTMKHVNDEFWQKFGPSMQAIAAADGNPDFFMFGEVALDGSGAAAKSFTSHYTTHDKMQAILDFPFQDAARGFASKGLGNTQLAQFFANDDWYTDADSNAYSLPTFLGNHDMGRIGRFVQADNAGAADAELLARDRLAHELMYFSRGNPVVYYGDEQGFTGAGGDQDARQTMFASRVPEYLDDDLLGTDRTHAQDNFVTDAPLYQSISRLAAVTDAHPALRNGAEQVRFASTGQGVFAMSRIDRKHQKEYVVALNNSESTASAQVPTFIRKGTFRKVYGAGPAQLATGSHGTLPVTLGGLSTSVYVSKGRIPRSQPRSEDQPGRAGAGDRVARPDARHGRRQGRLVLRGHLPAQAGSRWLADHRCRRLRAVPGLRRRLVAQVRRQGVLPRGGAGQRRPHQRHRCPRGHGARTTNHDRGAARGAQRARRRRGARGRRPRTGDPRGALRAQRGRRRVDANRDRLDVPGLHGVRRPRPVGAGCRDCGAVPGHSRRARWDHGHQRRALGTVRRPPSDDGAAALLPAGRRLRRLGSAPVG